MPYFYFNKFIVICPFSYSNFETSRAIRSKEYFKAIKIWGILWYEIEFVNKKQSKI